MGLCDLCLAVAISKHAPRISSWPPEVAVEYVARMRFSCIQRSSSASDHAPWGNLINLVCSNAYRDNCEKC